MKYLEQRGLDRLVVEFSMGIDSWREQGCGTAFFEDAEVSAVSCWRDA
jgi:hypothetical protein